MSAPASVLVARSLTMELKIAEPVAIDWDAESVAADELGLRTAIEVPLADADGSESELETSSTLPLLEAA